MFMFFYFWSLEFGPELDPDQEPMKFPRQGLV